MGADGKFANPLSREAKSGDLKDLDNPGSLFYIQNVHINPHYRGGETAATEGDNETDGAEGEGDPSGLKFGLERDLQDALRGNIAQLEPGLKITDGGKENRVDAGRVDITA